MLYVLLIKKPPCNPSLVCERREIALMAQDMKVVLQMVRRVCYTRVARRLLHEQVGWVSGQGAVDPALAAAIAIQQARECQHDLYMLYLDLATFFGSVDRGVLRACELWHGGGSPARDVLDLAFAPIYGSAAVMILSRLSVSSTRQLGLCVVSQSARCANGACFTR